MGRDLCCLDQYQSPDSSSLFRQINVRGRQPAGRHRNGDNAGRQSLLPLTVGLGISVFVALEHLFGRTVAIAAGSASPRSDWRCFTGSASR